MRTDCGCEIMKEIFLVIVLFFSGCAYAPHSTFVPYFQHAETAYQPWSKWDQIEILKDKPKSKKYIELGEIIGDGRYGNADVILSNMKRKAASIGGDALYLLQIRDAPKNNSSKAIVIRWAETTKLVCEHFKGTNVVPNECY